MNQITAHVPTSHLKAALLFAAKKDTRYYLNAVLIEFKERETVLVASDGAAIGAFRWTEDRSDEPGFVPQQVIIPRELCEAAVKTRSEFVLIEVGEGTCPRPLKLSGSGSEQSVTGKTVDARYPDWRSIMPAKCDGTVAQYSLELLSRFQKAGKLLKHPLARIGHNGDRGALVTFEECSEFAGVIMPYRVATVLECPEWVHGTKAAAKTA